MDIIITDILNPNYESFSNKCNDIFGCWNVGKITFMWYQKKFLFNQNKFIFNKIDLYDTKIYFYLIKINFDNQWNIFILYQNLF